MFMRVVTLRYQLTFAGACLKSLRVLKRLIFIENFCYIILVFYVIKVKKSNANNIDKIVILEKQVNVIKTHKTKT